MPVGILHNARAPMGNQPIGIGLASLLSHSLPTQVVFYPDMVLEDGIDTSYRFTTHHISTQQYGVNVVYAFATVDTHGTFVHYIGRAEVLSRRLSDHEKMSTAVARGANRLLIHEPKALDRVDYIAAERRLIERYCPPLNTHYNRLAGLGGLADLSSAFGLGR